MKDHPLAQRVVLIEKKNSVAGNPSHLEGSAYFTTTLTLKMVQTTANPAVGDSDSHLHSLRVKPLKHHPDSSVLLSGSFFFTLEIMRMLSESESIKIM